ncbi:MAG: class E sortase, partial [Acidimicrobiaceae bacterium]|nr:class E sortase [Acidimicrobiaceae bacterium]
VGGSGAGAANVDPAATFPGGVLDRMVIPRISLSKYVVQGVAENDLTEGPGHYPQTVLPGEKGNSAIAGHRTTYGAPFFKLNELHVGDRILITNLAGRQFVYKVSRPPFVVSPSDVAVLKPTPNAQLTLTTCNPRFSATSRLIVVAALTGAALPVTHPTELASSPPAADNNLGSGNSNAWPVTLGFGALVLIAWIATRLAINVTRKWWRLGAYVVGIGVCLIPLWFMFENVARLLPQNV